MKRIISAFMLVGMISCSNDNDGDQLYQAVSDFENAYEEMSQVNGVENSVTMDVLTHAYDFSLSSDREICSIGYQANIEELEFNIRVRRMSDSVVVYETTTSFSSSSTEYLELSSAVVLDSGLVYRLERECVGGYEFISDVIGRTLLEYNDSLPYSYNELTIHQSIFTDALSSWSSTIPSLNGRSLTGVPYIDIKFK